MLFRSPRTGNNLVGGINLHYLDAQRVDELASALPSIMQGSSLYSRYQAGLRAVPEIFTNFYRTYDSKFIRGVRQDIMYPKYGTVKTVSKDIQNKIDQATKTPTQRAKESEPEYPEDLTNMQKKLDDVVQQLQTQPPPAVDPQEPEMQVARAEYQKSQAEPYQNVVRQDEREEQEAADAVRELEAQPETAVPSPAEAPAPTLPEQPLAASVQSPEEPLQPVADTPTAPAPVEAPPSEEEEAIPELTDIADANTKEDLEESIIYYSPTLRRYVVEQLV